MRLRVIYDATLLVNAYLTEVYRTGLFRVCDELLKRLAKREGLDIVLYDTFGRERELRQYVVDNYAGVHVLEQDTAAYRWLTYAPLRLADRLRKREKDGGLPGAMSKILKGLIVRYARLISRLTPRSSGNAAGAGAAHYVATYYPIPQWVHDNGTPATIIIHDLIPIIHPEYFASTANRDVLAEICDSITRRDKAVCVSDSTRRDLLQLRQHIAPQAVSVAHLAGAEVFKPTPLSADLAQRLDAQDGNFLLSACTLEPRKNMALLVNAYKLLLEGNSGNFLPLVLTGAYGWKGEALMEQIADVNSRFPNSIRLAGYVSDDELAQLYSGCAAFVYPSLYEGFGLPPLEAMQCGAPVVVSNNSSLPEVVGSAGLMVDAHDAQGLASAIMALLADRAAWQQRSLSRAQEFSWDRFAGGFLSEL